MHLKNGFRRHQKMISARTGGEKNLCVDGEFFSCFVYNNIQKAVDY